MVSHQENQDCVSLTLEAPLPWIHTTRGMNIPTAIVCHQCEDALCANVHPNGTISRDKGFVHVIQERCIGCKTCVVARPHGAMEVVVRPVTHNSGIGLNVRAGKAEVNKCDLCNHREDGPVYMAAYSTHALICVDRNKLEQLSMEERRHMALMFQKSYRIVLVLKGFPKIFVEYEVDNIADLRLPNAVLPCPARRITQFMMAGIT